MSGNSLLKLAEKAVGKAGANASVITDDSGYPTHVVAIRPQFSAGHKNRHAIDIEQPLDELVADIADWWAKHTRLYYRQ